MIQVFQPEKIIYVLTPMAKGISKYHHFRFSCFAFAIFCSWQKYFMKGPFNVDTY